jgi:hypothetical protein
VRRVVLFAAAGLSLARPASAQSESDTGWDPGDATTSTVEGEVQGSERSTSGDGVYGRFDGDLELALAAGAELQDDAQRAAARLSLHYFSMMGLGVGYAERIGGDGALRVAVLGVDLRPAFIPRWSRGYEQGPGVLDLMVDSISLGVGAFWATPDGGDFGDRRGFELSGGLGLPLTGRSPGPWIEARALGRWPEQTASESGGGEAVALLLISWHAFVTTPLAD